MPNRYQDIYPSKPLFDSSQIRRQSARELMTVEYFEAEPASMPHEIFNQHHILINLRDEPTDVENWRGDAHRKFVFHRDEIVVTPAGIKSGWRWHQKSKVIVITLEPKKFGDFALRELGIQLSSTQLLDQPQFLDQDITQAASILKDTMTQKEIGSELMYESLARVFLVKLIQKYGLKKSDQIKFQKGFSSEQYKRVLDFIRDNLDSSLKLSDLARVAGLSDYHFSRLFKKTLGRSPMQYVLIYRIEQAKKFLAETDLPLSDIAQRCGFFDQAHMSNSFAKIEHKSPKLFRH